MMRDGAVNRLSQPSGEALMRAQRCARLRGQMMVLPMKLLLIEDNVAMQTTLQRSFE